MVLRGHGSFRLYTGPDVVIEVPDHCRLVPMNPDFRMGDIVRITNVPDDARENLNFGGLGVEVGDLGHISDVPPGSGLVVVTLSKFEGTIPCHVWWRPEDLEKVG